MLTRFRRDPLVGNVIALVALFIALGAGAYAAGLAPDSVKSKHIVNGQVKEADLAAPEDWQEVEHASDPGNACLGGATGVFCSYVVNEASNNWAPWANLDSEHASAAFYKDQLGVVHLKGLVNNWELIQGNISADEHVIFRLPEPYRPDRVRVFPSIGDEPAHGADVAVSRVDVRPGGDVVFIRDCDEDDIVCSSRAYDYLTLDGITFRPDG